MNITTNYDLTIIGGGPAGETAAIHASNLGLKVALIEKAAYLGGTCLNVGCIPTKALITVAKTLILMKKTKRLGLEISDLTYEWHNILKYKNSIIENQRKGLLNLLKNKNVDIYLKSKAKISNQNTIEIENLEKCEKHNINTKYILIATGSTIKNLNNININEKNIFSSDGILSIEQIPHTLAIIGGGIIGIEFACLFAILGVKVSVFEMMPNILSQQDQECIIEIQKFLKRYGVKIYTNYNLQDIQITDNHTIILSNQKENLEFDKLLIAIGRKPQSEQLWDPNLNINKNSKGFIEVNEHYQTNYPNIYAVGDVINTPALAHIASHESLYVVNHILKHPIEPINYNAYPNVIYTIPELASVGFTTEDLDLKKLDYGIVKFPFSPLAKANIEQCREGFIKILYNKNTKQILGVHILHDKASELISEFTIAIQHQLPLDKIKSVIHPHPTISETITESIYNAVYYPKTLHL